ncbi:ShlB/FhaC/HecB family hemolysin secretion/activation protein [Sphingomonas sp. BAUL-RG-20F-R05-02]|uniref:ShlB/FhaC/HecB family hemolysin secretion/activation protein n=1 Tax=Sphingomonas sp. BAUL-RG-20F-R05-02 TaxID=2914830 RepID=UPI001F58A149|nr:ShlB/FhaC/HecB family hemolysin secretion/activation protein [Sphingomonas sp. BAUL-RG-20F-R05-02]
MRNVLGVLAGGAAAVNPWSAAQAQAQLNRADPSILERVLPQSVKPLPANDPVVTIEPKVVTAPSHVRLASAIIVEGGREIARSTFSDALVNYIGRDLTDSDLKTLSHAVADVARKAGYPFANAWIEPQTLANGILRVSLDAGSLAAVRVIGHTNTLANKILTNALVTGRPVRSDQLERAILLVGDIPGVSVKESRFVRQNGFGILLVTIAEDRLTAYAQIDNRGSKEVGPLRSTIIANAHGVFQTGDEASLVLAQTPIQPSEFVFVRGRYAMPIDADGATLSASASYGRAKPGATLKPLDVTGESYDASLFYTKPLVRRRDASLWGTVEVRGLRSNQTLLGIPLRDDRIATLTGTVSGTAHAGSGILRGEVHLIDGLPLPGVTHEGDQRASRSDGDARFVILSYAAEWTAPLAGRLSLSLATEGQIASRPLLATMEIGGGGPTFGRAYDYAERTGDDGILGSSEIRFDLGQVIPRMVSRLQVYASADGGYVSNLRGGFGGGTLLSTAAGLRAGRGKLSAAVEVALPLNADRFDTKKRNPRFSFRLSRLI